MRSIITGLLMLAAMGCTTTANKLAEPGRTFYYIQCIQSGRMITECECTEQKVVEKTGMTDIKTQKDSDKWLPVLEEVVESGICVPKEEPKEEAK